MSAMLHIIAAVILALCALYSQPLFRVITSFTISSDLSAATFLIIYTPLQLQFYYCI